MNSMPLPQKPRAAAALAAVALLAGLQEACALRSGRNVSHDLLWSHEPATGSAGARVLRHRQDAAEKGSGGDRESAGQLMSDALLARPAALGATARLRHSLFGADAAPVASGGGGGDGDAGGSSRPALDPGPSALCVPFSSVGQDFVLAHRSFLPDPAGGCPGDADALQDRKSVV